MTVEIQLKESSMPIVYENAINAYTKGPLYCVLFVNSNSKRVTHKFPVQSIFRIIEDYPESKR
jgi:hypothetical protein